MTSAPDDHFRGLPHLLSMGAIGAATAAVFFGIAFLWRTPPHPTKPPADMDAPAQALEFQEVPPPANNDAAGASSSAPTVDKAAASLTSAAASEHELPALAPTALETAFVPPARSARATRVRFALYHRQVAPKRHGVAPWRPDARAGPNSGGGFYGPPNVNVGYINPR
jgi:hypothetical protein